MAAQREEAVARADVLAPEDLGEDRREALLHRAARGDVRLDRSEIGRGERAAIDLAVGRERDLRQRHEGRGHHVRGEPRFEVGRELGG